MADRHTVHTRKAPSPPPRARHEGIPHEGRELESIGPSDSSDSGSDLVSGSGAEGTSDRSGTGERLSVDDDGRWGDAGPGVASDIAPDRIIGADEAGLGGGLDQAEEAQLGVTDEELERRRKLRS